MQFWAVTLITLWLPSTRELISGDFVLVVFVWCMFSLYVQGTFLEGRRYAQKLEGVRLCLLILGIILASEFWPSVTPEVTNIALTYAVSSLCVFVSHELFANRQSIAPARG